MNCPCDSGHQFDQCCGQFISHRKLPENAQQLMRSRYSAYVLLLKDYLVESWHPHHRPQELVLHKDIKWLGLALIDFQSGERTATVEFEARLLQAGKVDALHEISRFVLERDHWLYTSGDHLAPSFHPWKPGRNQTCPCGSGYRFKRCCAGP
jgi:SEC-C motif-containing protein